MTDKYQYVSDNLAAIKSNIADAAAKCGRAPEDIRIMAVTKTVAPEIVNYAVSLGVALLGENRAQEFMSKQEAYDKSAEIHFIGGLQTNKVKYIIDSVDMIQSVDSLKLAAEIDRHAGRVGRVMDVLAEVNIGGELSKGGVSPEELPDLLKSMAELPNIKVKGLMTIPPPQDPEKFLGRMQELYIDISEKRIDNINMSFLSMGMSGDYELAVKYGSNILRIGTALFGARIYR